MQCVLKIWIKKKIYVYEDYFYKLFNMKGYKEFFKTLMEIYFTFT